MRQEVEQRPWVNGLGFEMGVDCLRGRWDDERKVMTVALRTYFWSSSLSHKYQEEASLQIKVCID